MSAEKAGARASGRNHGGSRPGSGRKPETLSGQQVQKMLRAAKRRAKREGKTLDDIILDIAYDTEAPRKDVLAAIKLFKDKTMATISEGGAADKALGPAFFLPEKHPRLSVVSGGKSE